jgi:hypothetical protein
MLPRYINVMWICTVVLIFGLQTFAVFVSHENRDIMYMLSAALFALAFCVTLVHNKIKFGVYFPGTKRK